MNLCADHEFLATAVVNSSCARHSEVEARTASRSFGVVQHGVHRSSREEVAVKRILKSGNRDIQQIANELDVLKSTKHKNLCLMLELLDTPDFPYIVPTDSSWD